MAQQNNISSERSYLPSTMAMSSSNDDPYRLPKSIRPTAYALSIWTDLSPDALRFGGTVQIELDVIQPTSAIVLNCSSDLNVGKATIILDGQPESVEILDKSAERLTVKLPPGVSLAPGANAALKLAFNAPLRTSMNGYYRSSWQKDGKPEYYTLTHFQPTDARAAFPCFDEPELKAKFTITMISRAGLVSLSNMPAVSESVYRPGTATPGELKEVLSALPNDSDWTVTKFAETPLISTYIIAFATGGFEYREKMVDLPLNGGRTIPLRVYATPDLVHQAGFCLDVTAQVLPFYEKVFNIAYPLPKLDTLAANDFDMGAMENWGLITGRSVMFLVDPATNDVASQQLVAKIQSHEVAHMWFGNIATMSWWDYLYLNEGFASLVYGRGHRARYVSKFCFGSVNLGILDKVYPEWQLKATFLRQHMDSALNIDAKRASHPIEVPCPDVAFLNQIFDDLSYSKAASVLYMLSNYVSEEKFLRGVSIYLNKHLYGNTVSEDLWDGIAEATGLDILGMMDNWVKKTGFPLITVTETTDGVKIRQDRFLDSGSPTEKENETIWTVPLFIRTQDANGGTQTDTEIILKEREQTYAIDTNRPFKINGDSVGVYRVLYTPDRLSKIATEAAKPESAFSLCDRMGLVYDIAALSTAGRAPISSLLDLVDAWKNETNCMVWFSVASSLTGIYQTFSDIPEIISGLKAFIPPLFLPILQRLGYDSPEGSVDSVDNIELRKIAINMCLRADVQSVIEELHNRFIKYMDTGDEMAMHPNIRFSILTAAAKVGGKREFEALLRLCEDESKPALKRLAIASIGRVEKPEIMEQLFEYIRTKARDQDAVSFFRGLQANPIGRRRLAKFAMDNYDDFAERFATNSMLKYYVEDAFCTLTSQADYDAIVAFFKDKDTGRYNMALAQVLEGVQSQIDTIAARFFSSSSL
ncbi:Leucyl aminopeptidase [Mycena kentingensis (nom. inval.)]|nr:Leucyl aminopeptidase [Mycena kentingensis (nom. inval.)]